MMRIFLHRWILLIFGVIVILCIGLWVVLNQYLDAPVYEQLNISSPSSYLVNGGWNKEDFSIEMNENGHDKFSIWRVEDYISFEEVGVKKHYSSEEELFATLTQWFEDNGWEKEDLKKYDVCDFMPESKFLVADNKFGYIGFRRSSKNLYAYLPTACIAMWRYERFQTYYFVVTTISPSRRTSFLRCLRIGCE